MMFISDRIGASRPDMKFTFRVVSPNSSSPLAIGVKTEDDLKQWVEAIRNCSSRSSSSSTVC